jgi:hypothetical protein
LKPRWENRDGANSGPESSIEIVFSLKRDQR